MSEKANPIEVDDPQPDELRSPLFFLNIKGEEDRTTSILKKKGKKDKGKDLGSKRKILETHRSAASLRVIGGQIAREKKNGTKRTEAEGGAKYRGSV